MRQARRPCTASVRTARAQARCARFAPPLVHLLGRGGGRLRRGFPVPAQCRRSQRRSFGFLDCVMRRHGCRAATRCSCQPARWPAPWRGSTPPKRRSWQFSSWLLRRSGCARCSGRSGTRWTSRRGPSLAPEPAVDAQSPFKGFLGPKHGRSSSPPALCEETKDHQRREQNPRSQVQPLRKARLKPRQIRLGDQAATLQSLRDDFSLDLGLPALNTGRFELAGGLQGIKKLSFP